MLIYVLYLGQVWWPRSMLTGKCWNQDRMHITLRDHTTASLLLHFTKGALSASFMVDFRVVMYTAYYSIEFPLWQRHRGAFKKFSCCKNLAHYVTHSVIFNVFFCKSVHLSTVFFSCLYLETKSVVGSNKTVGLSLPLKIIGCQAEEGWREYCLQCWDVLDVFVDSGGAELSEWWLRQRDGIRRG